jgi:hypothetical protein
MNWSLKLLLVFCWYQISAAEPEIGAEVENKIFIPEVKNLSLGKTPQVNLDLSGQFTISGGERMTRQAVARFVDEIIVEFNKLTGLKQSWQRPIVISLIDEKSDVWQSQQKKNYCSSQITPLDYGDFHLQVNLSTHLLLQTDLIRREIIRMVLAEMILKNHPSISYQRKPMLPEWLLQGVLLSMEYQRRSSPSAMFAAVFKTGKIYSIEKMLTTDPSNFDGLSKIVYDTSCAALVMTLLDQSEGGLKLAQMINQFPVNSKSELELIKNYFPKLGLSSTSLNKWWSLQFATLSKRTMNELLTTEQSVQHMVDLLFFYGSTEPDDRQDEKNKNSNVSTNWFKRLLGVSKDENVDVENKENATNRIKLPITEYEKILKYKQGRQWLESLGNKFIMLQYHVSPLCRELCLQYATVVNDLAKGKVKNVHEKLAQLQELGRFYALKSKEISVELDLLQVNESQHYSGLFNDYLNLKKSIQAEAIQFNNPISIYLDILEDKPLNLQVIPK